MRIKSFMLLSLALLGCIIYTGQPLSRFYSKQFDIGIIAAIIAVVLFFHYSQHSPLKGYWFRPSILFLIGYLAVNFQYLADYRLGFKTDESRMILYPDVLNHCMLLGVVGIMSFVSGYILKPIKGNNLSTHKLSSTKVQLPTTFLVLLNVFFFIAFLLTIDIVSFVTGADFGNSEGVNSSFEALLYVSNALIVCAVCMKQPTERQSLKQYIKSFPTISLIIVSLYMLLRLLSGDRGPVIYSALLLLFGYAYYSRIKIRLSRALILLLSGALIMSVVGIARSMEINRRFGERMGAALEMFANGGRFVESGEKSISPLTEELGFSFIVNQTDVKAIEENDDELNYGLYTVLGIVSSIPFMPGYLQNTLGIPPEKMSSPNFANYHFFGGYERNWGIGTTILGDFYLQFSVWGVLIGLFLTGILFRFLDINLYCKNKTLIGAFTLLFVLLFSAKSIYMPRATLLTELPRFVLGSLFLLVLGVKRKKIS